MSNQARLFFLVFLAFLPMIGLYAYASSALERAELDSRETELTQIANMVALEYGRLLEEGEALLGALSEFPEIRNPRQPECNRILASVMGHLEYYTSLQLIEDDGFVGCGSLSAGESLYVGDRYYHQATRANNQFTVGNYVVGRRTGKPIITFAHPVPSADGAAVDAVLAGYIDLTKLGNSVFEMEMPEGSTFTVLDRTGTVMVRVPAGQNPMGHDTVGASVPETFPMPTGDVSGTYLASGTDLDGIDRVFAVAPLRASTARAQGYLLVGLEESALLEATGGIVVRQLQLLALGGVFLLVLAWMFGHYTLLRDPVVSEP
jgi:hypothetical protein